MRNAGAAFAAALFLCGCATIVGGAADQPVAITSVPDGATISIRNRSGAEVHHGTTPATVALKKKAGYFRHEGYQVRIEKPGYAAQAFSLSWRLSAWYFGNIIIPGGLIGLALVDPATGAMWKIKPDTIERRLEPLDPQSSAPESIK